MLHVGEALCLSAALLWAISLTVFRGAIASHGPRAVNLAKCLLAAVLQTLTVAAVGQAGALLHPGLRDGAFLAASGVVGLTLGDTALFGAVARLGVHRALLLQTLSPVFTAVLALVWQGERPTGTRMIGAGLVLVGVAVVVGPRRRGGGPASAAAGDAAARVVAVGIVLAVLAALGQAIGVVLAKSAMERVPVLPASAIRLVAASTGLALIGLADRRLARLRGLLGDRGALARVLPATLMGTYLALFLMMAGLALAPAAIAAVLLSTSPVFSLFIERIVFGRPITVAGLTGTVLAVVGVAVMWS